MNAETAHGGLSQQRKRRQASSLLQALRWFVGQALERLRLWPDLPEDESRRRDIARVRALAGQVRSSQPGYADDLMAAAAALESHRLHAREEDARSPMNAVRPNRAPPQTPLPARAS
jgi:hypothetical protein